jgi:hypothetical protein
MNPRERPDLFRPNVAGEANRRRFPVVPSPISGGSPVGGVVGYLGRISLVDR